MPRKKLSSLFLSNATDTSIHRKCAPAQPEIATFKKGVYPFRKPKSSPSSSSGATVKGPWASPSVSQQVLSRLKEAASRNTTNSKAHLASGEDSAVEISKAISSILCGDDDIVLTKHPSPSKDSHDDTQPKSILDVPWFSNMSQISTAPWKKEISRERKQKYIFKTAESRRFIELMRRCADKLGTESTLEFFERLGREMGVKEYNSLIKLCIRKARKCTKEEDSLVHVNKVYGLFESMREKGLQIEEESYNPLLIYMVDMKLTKGFQMFSELLKNENPKSGSRIGYYEMLLWIRVGNEDKIQELLDCIRIIDEDSYGLAESYLLAFCESGRKKELLQLLEVLDIRKISSPKCMTKVLTSLGSFQLEELAEGFLLALNASGVEAETISFFIFEYTIGLPNLAVEDVVSKFTNLHQKLGVVPSIPSYEKLIELCCNLCKAQTALDIVDHMGKSGLNIPIEVFHPILHACEQFGELEMAILKIYSSTDGNLTAQVVFKVHPIYLMMHQHDLKPDEDTFKSMISLFVKMKDFEGAYNFLAVAEEMNEIPTTSMYNIIMAGYFREKKNPQALLVLKQMEDADIKPDSETFSYLILNCEREADIIKYHDEMRRSGILFTKYVYMALVNAYANCGNFEMAKQVILDDEIPVKYLNEIKSVLVSSLSSNGQIHDALDVYAEIKQSGSVLDPKAAICLIEHLQTEGELCRLLQLLEELSDSNSWFDGCRRVVLYCVRWNDAGSAIVLLKQLKDKDESSIYYVIDQVFSQIWETTPTNLKIGLELLRAVKELDLHPTRTSLDFLLSTCVKAKDSQIAWLIWSEYETAGLEYNVLTSVRMYQALLASGELTAANEMLKRIPKADGHVRCLIKSCKMAYCRSTSSVKEVKN